MFQKFKDALHLKNVYAFEKIAYLKYVHEFKKYSWISQKRLLIQKRFTDKKNILDFKKLHVVEQNLNSMKFFKNLWRNFEFKNIFLISWTFFEFDEQILDLMN